MIPTIVSSVLLISTYAHALNLPLAYGIYPDLANTSLSNSLNATRLGVSTWCSKKYGANINVLSCENAWEKIPTFSEAQQFRTRKPLTTMDPSDM